MCSAFLFRGSIETGNHHVNSTTAFNDEAHGRVNVLLECVTASRYTLKDRTATAVWTTNNQQTILQLSTQRPGLLNGGEQVTLF